MGKNYKNSYRRFLHTEAWRHTKEKALERRRKKWKKKGLDIPNNKFLCNKCKKIKYLTNANYHHTSYTNWYGGNGWSNHRNVIIICKECHDWRHRKKIKKKSKEEYKRIKELRKKNG
ncbi:hypothetical protein LCGC14_2377220 [marine sediment metagenome]|uniref:HNH domain-containing protein n=1 Tax=marine sediment metagenome TaxID=412755 RepID=A0A0F9C272_9ZZZZ